MFPSASQRPFQYTGLIVKGTPQADVSYWDSADGNLGAIIFIMLRYLASRKLLNFMLFLKNKTKGKKKS